MYLTYEEYRANGGTLPEEAFPAAELKARKRVDYLTDNRVRDMATVPISVKLGMMTLIRADCAVGAEAELFAPVLAAFSTDGYSESYGSPSERSARAERKVNGELRTLLHGEKDDEGTPLLFRGVN